MKFSVEKVIGSARLGTIAYSCQGNITLETPMCTLFTKSGSAPYLGIDMLKRITNLPGVSTMSLNSLAPQHETIAAFGKGLGEYTALKQGLIFTTLHDASVAVTSGKNDRNGVSVWGKGGKFKMDPALFVKIQEALRPDWFQALSDGDTDKTTNRKRLAKAVNNTLDFLDDTIELIDKSQTLKDAWLIGAVEGGFDEDERVRSAKETAARPVQGFIIEGFEKGHSGTDLFEVDNFTKILSKTVNCLPENKPRVMDNVWSPLEIIKAFQLGIDIFSSSYPHLLTEKGRALVADYSLPAPASEPAQVELVAGDGDKVASSSGMYIDLKDKCHFEAFSPLKRGCSCYCCANFTRSYIHHLLNTSELLAYVLLTIHNFHQFFEFFQHLRKAAREGNLKGLQSSLEKQNDSQATGR